MQNTISRPLSTGFVYLDSALGGGFPPGRVTLLASYPSTGKSAFMTESIVRLSARLEGAESRSPRVAWISARDPARKNLEDMVTSYCGLKWEGPQGPIPPTEMQMAWLRGELRRNDSFDVDLHSWRPKQPSTDQALEAIAASQGDAPPLDMIFVDDLQYVGRGGPMGEESTEARRLLSELQRRHPETPIVASTWVHRGQRDEAPTVDRINGADELLGAVETVVLMHDPISVQGVGTTGPRGDWSPVELEVRGPNGRAGAWVSLEFSAATKRFREPGGEARTFAPLPGA